MGQPERRADVKTGTQKRFLCLTGGCCKLEAFNNWKSKVANEHTHTLTFDVRNALSSLGVAQQVDHRNIMASPEVNRADSPQRSSN